ncbi:MULTISPECIES: glycosyltransferase family 2 protein [unclassified Microbacterium]|uniref:glycosyltransferase family 2 protein n=1 Tax=unclassified Microbacterium TaxID=2609290 RepID=UPI00214CA3FB|nr:MULTISPECIES: glycosyltransferase family 2 protein [unclassified Microbacterium]MCR2808904.1 glycosyltransferase family 2 protein [Microbacterium sp. zg.B185]WIM18676.1 glycosyltransferase family 2 protein [Microbacterium sp. zg-B185]
MLTVFNRREGTLLCLRSLALQNGMGDLFDLRVVLFDDGSSDGTAAAVRAEFADFVHVIEGSGDQFWARGMALAHVTATQDAPDAVLWLNDDVELDRDSVSRAVAAMTETSDGAIIVGATTARGGGAITYSGARLRTSRPGSLAPVLPTDGLVRIDAFNGNFVCIPRAVYEALGPVESRYEHAYGDIDYGLRARARGIPCYLLPGTIGSCERNGAEGTWRDRTVSRAARFSMLLGRKGYPPRSHWLFNRRHGGVMAPIYFVATYARAVGAILLRRAA